MANSVQPTKKSGFLGSSQVALIFILALLGRQLYTAAPYLNSLYSALDRDASAVMGIPREASSTQFITAITGEFLNEKNYFYRAWKKWDGKHLPPMEILLNYIEKHSHNRLVEEYRAACPDPTKRCVLDETNSKRKFVVAPYSCPLQSGNRFHRFMNGLLWAVLTDRTFLWRYETYPVCKEYKETLCETEYELMTGPSDCDGILIRNPWIPSYDDWKDRLGIKPEDIIRAETAFPKNDWKPDKTTLPIDGVSAEGKDNGAIRVIRPGKQIGLNPGQILAEKPNENDHVHLVQPENLERLEKVNSLGEYFTYGMLFEALFTIDPALEPPADRLHDKNSEPRTRSIFLHSRHPGHDDNERYIWPEFLCMGFLMEFLGAKNEALPPKVANITSANPPPCHIYVMSDRPTSVQVLEEKIAKKTHCTSSALGSDESKSSDSDNGDSTEKEEQHELSSISFHAEHGPRAGRGYWEDFALAIQARDGMIAFHMPKHPKNPVRSSSALMREVLEFRRFLEDDYSDIFTSTPRNKHRLRNLEGKFQHPGMFECTNPFLDPRFEERKDKLPEHKKKARFRNDNHIFNSKEMRQQRAAEKNKKENKKK